MKDSNPAYYLLRPGVEKEEGPYNLSQIVQLWDGRQIPSETMFAQEGSPDWKPVSLLMVSPQVDELRGQAAVRESRTRAKQKASVIPPLILVGVLFWAVIYFMDPGQDRTTGLNAPASEDIPTGWISYDVNKEVEPVPAGLMAKARGMGRHVSAYRTATNFVSGMLLAPATAKFSSFKESQVSGESRPWIRGWVDAQNGFGALIRIEFDVRLATYTSGAWRIDQVLIKDKTGIAELTQLWNASQ